MARIAATWHGTNAERDRLLAAISRNCGCTNEVICAPHEMLVNDGAQKTLDGLLFHYRIRDCLIAEERRV